MEKEAKNDATASVNENDWHFNELKKRLEAILTRAMNIRFDVNGRLKVTFEYFNCEKGFRIEVRDDAPERLVLSASYCRVDGVWILNNIYFYDNSYSSEHAAGLCIDIDFRKLVSDTADIIMFATEIKEQTDAVV